MLVERLPLLITGVAGVAGYNAFSYFQKRFPGQVFGMRPTRNWRLTGEGILDCDLEDHSKVASLFDQYRFRSVLHCGGSCALKSCELDPAMANRVNVVAVDSLLTAMEKQPHADDIRSVFLSIDLVFSGFRCGDYVETDEPDPVTVYGKTMVIAERMIESRVGGAALLRISLPMGVSFNGHAGAVDWIASRFKKNLPATLYYDEVRTPTYVQCLNRVFEFFLDGNQDGLFHAGGSCKLSLFEIAQIVNFVGGYERDLLKGCFRIEAGPIPPRAGNVTLRSEKLAELMGHAPFLDWPLDKQLIPDSRTWHRDTDNRFIDSKGNESIEKYLYSANAIHVV